MNVINNDGYGDDDDACCKVKYAEFRFKMCASY